MILKGSAFKKYFYKMEYISNSGNIVMLNDAVEYGTVGWRSED